MKKIFFFLLLGTMMSLQMRAQVNPKPGFIITNHGDTIRGNIDFRTNEKLSKQCEFWANGGNEDTTYKPGDIEGFRFDNGGKYFYRTSCSLQQTKLWFSSSKAMVYAFKMTCFLPQSSIY